MKFYIIYFEDGSVESGNFDTYCEALDFAESISPDGNFTIEEYSSEEDYLSNL